MIVRGGGRGWLVSFLLRPKLFRSSAHGFTTLILTACDVLLQWSLSGDQRDLLIRLVNSKGTSLSWSKARQMWSCFRN